MKNYFYLVITPESLIVSHLSPLDFGNYLSVGTKKRIRGQNMFFELDPYKLKKLPMTFIKEKMIPYNDGEPKRSVYCSIYRVLENTPLDAIKKFYLSTDDGKVLELEPAPFESLPSDEIHLYQQLSPTTTRVASKLPPEEFIQFLTDTTKPVSAPKVVFAELLLNELASDPKAALNNLPYQNPDHLRDCLIKLKETEGKQTKTVLRSLNRDLMYRTIKSGFFVGEKKQFLYFPFPDMDELESDYYGWWRSALTMHFW